MEAALSTIRAADQICADYNVALADHERLVQACLDEGATKVSAVDGRCSNCGLCAGTNGVEKLQHCSQCMVVAYCSKECQKQDWKRGHKLNCASVCKSLKGAGSTTSSRPWKREFEAVEKWATTDNERCLAAASQSARNTLIGDPELRGALDSMRAIKWETLGADSPFPAMLQKGFAGSEQHAKELETPTRRQALAVALAQALKPLTLALTAQGEAGAAKRAQRRLRKIKGRANVVVIESNTMFVEDLSTIPSQAATISLFCCRVSLLEQYIRARFEEADSPSPTSHLDESAKQLCREVRATDPSHVPILVCYRHKEDSTGMAMTHVVWKDAAVAVTSLGGGLAQVARMHDIQALELTLPSMQIVCFDFDQGNFETMLGPSSRDAEPSSRGFIADAEADADEADELSKAIASIKLQCPDLTAKEVHAELIKTPRWEEKSLSQVKRACSKTAKAAVAHQKNTLVTREKAAEAQNRMLDSFTDAVDSGSLRAWQDDLIAKGLAPKTPADTVGSCMPGDHSKMQLYVLKYMEYLSAFAAVKYSELGKGALFVFSRIGFADLIDFDPKLRDDAHGMSLPGPRQANVLDRQFVLMWGTQSSKPNSPFTASSLYEKFPGYVKTLPKSIEACSEKNFPMVIACDPSGKQLSKVPREVLRCAKRPPATAAYDRASMQNAVCTLPFMDFEGSVQWGMNIGYHEQDVAGINMDRHFDDPAVA